MSYILLVSDFINKICRTGSIPDNAILVTADVMTLYPSIHHNVGLKPVREVSEKREQKKITNEQLVQVAEYVLKHNCFEFDGRFTN